MSETTAVTQTKSQVDPCRDSRDYPVTKNADGQTDRQTPFQLYIVDIYIYIYIYNTICYIIQCNTFTPQIKGKSQCI